MSRLVRQGTLEGEGGLERAAGVFYVRPSVRYQFKHPQASKRREPLSTRLRA